MLFALTHLSPHVKKLWGQIFKIKRTKIYYSTKYLKLMTRTAANIASEYNIVCVSYSMMKSSSPNPFNP